MTDGPDPRTGGGLPEQEVITEALIDLALREDVGAGDATTEATVDSALQAAGQIRAMEPGVLSGLAVAAQVVRRFDRAVRFQPLFRDGDRVGGPASAAPGSAAPAGTASEPPGSGVVVARLGGSARSLLTLERVVLNFLQHLSGVATLTSRFVEAVAGTGVTIVDTRKTTPGMRSLEKAAVRHGGGSNHRAGLWDAYMIKDNHIAAAGSISEAVRRVRRGRPLHLTVETSTLAEVEEAAACDVDQIMLDNMDPAMIRRAVDFIRRRDSRWDRPVLIEVSGGVTLDTVRAKALPGVDLISIGALTHSAPALDLSSDLTLSRHEAGE
jgi:nicotinate-nucleotide pyrophosphorylase (carboxylating)